MDILFLFSVTCLVGFMVLATYDGVYLHLWKYELFNRVESEFEHKVHTVRAILFPIIVLLLFVKTDLISFYVGIILIILDLVVLGMDAYSEKESRSFMGGLPKWEYVLHLFANSFHFATFMLIIATRIEIGENAIVYSTVFLTNDYFKIVQLIAKNILPGAILLGGVHCLLTFDFVKRIWKIYRVKIKCC